MSAKKYAFSLTYGQQLQQLKKSKHFHSSWYANTYSDVESSGLSPAEHFLKYGDRLGRKPARYFDTDFYKSYYPDVELSKCNSLVHYILVGKKEGRFKSERDVVAAARMEVKGLRRKLRSLGFIEKAVDDLFSNLKSNKYLRSLSARELAHWSVRDGSQESIIRCLEFIKIAKEIDLGKEYASQIAVVEILCNYYLGKIDQVNLTYRQFESRFGFCPDVSLAASNIHSAISEKEFEINKVLGFYEIPKIKLDFDVGDKPQLYDNIFMLDNLQKVAKEGPLVTVLVACYNAESTIETTLRSLSAQTWQRLEVLILDDVSTDRTRKVVREYIKKDNRFRLLKMDRNGGAYIARNRGLQEAMGEFVTIHDADDWSHPVKIERQVNYLLNNLDVIGCTSQQARANNELKFLRWTGDGKFIISNTSSFMFRKEEVVKNLGGWDTVRFSADNELIRRIQTVFGKESIVHMPTGPLSFQRDSDSSIIAHSYFGVNGAMFGVRKEYLEAQRHYHNSGKSPYYSGKPNDRPFYAPKSMRGKSTLGRVEDRHFDVIISTDFRMPGGSVISCLEEIRAQARAGLKTGIFELYRYDLNPDGKMLGMVRDLINELGIEVLTYGESVSCDLLIIRYPPVLQYYQQFIPAVSAKDIKVIINQLPMSDYSEKGIVRYTMTDCQKNLFRMFGRDAVWHPISHTVADNLYDKHADEVKAINFSPEPWANIIDVALWGGGVRSYVNNSPIRIGRHSRDNYVKWPDTKEEILAAYPSDNGFEVNVLGGVESIKSIMGKIPLCWNVRDFNDIPPKRFLENLDVYVYFTSKYWVEAFGRSILEAMASGLPVILPSSFRNTFGDAAIYCEVWQVGDVVKDLLSKPDEYSKRSLDAIDFVKANFGYEAHLKRLSRHVEIKSETLIEKAMV